MTIPSTAANPGPSHLADPVVPAPAPATVHPANPAAYLKAVAAAVIAGLGVLYVSLNDGTVTPQEWIDVAQTSIVAAASVYGIPNFAARP